MSGEPPPAGDAAPAPSVHATALLVGETGILICGPSGAGKSSLAMALIDGARTAGRFASLVADDRVRLAVAGGRLTARAHPTLSGLVERRGQGIVRVPFEPAARIHCVVDIVPGDRDRDIPPRAPLATDAHMVVQGVDLPRLAIALGTSPEEGARRVTAFLPYV